MVSRKAVAAVSAAVLLLAWFFWPRGASAPDESAPPPPPPGFAVETPPSAPAVSEPGTPYPAGSEAVRAKLAVLGEILASKNDNDPRLDTDFRNLSPALKSELRRKYDSLAHEDRNGRGTIVFLLGREIASPEDVEFFTLVLRESPCLSLADCGRRPPQGVDEHAAMAGQVTLVYPQMVAIKSFERALAAGTSGPRAEIVDALRAAQNSEQADVARAARETWERLKL